MHRLFGLTPRFGLIFIIAAAGLLRFAPAIASAEPIAGEPWHHGHADDLLVYGKSLWSDTEQKVVHEGGFLTPTVIYPVVNRPDLVVYQWISADQPQVDLGILVPATLYAPKGDPKQTIKFPPAEAKKQGVKHFLNPDYRRVVMLKDGDIYRGEFDWATGEVVNEKKVTDLGVLQSSPFLWHDNLLFLYGGFDEEKPLLRVNLLTGDLQELPTFDVLPPSPGAWDSAVANPSASHLIGFDNELIRVLDVRTLKLDLISIVGEYKIRGRMNKAPIRMYRKDAHRWIDDRTLLASDKSFGTIALLELDHKRVRLLSPKDRQMQFKELLPGGAHADVVLMDNPENPRTKPQPQSRILLDIKTGEFMETPIPIKVDVRWQSDSIGIYSLHEGGLSKVGTWLYNRATNEVTRLTVKSAQLHNIAFLPKRERVFLSVHQDGSYGFGIDGEGQQKLGDDERMVAFGQPIDLGFAGDGEPLWVEKDYDAIAAQEAATVTTASTEAASQAPATPDTLVEVLNALEGESDAIRAEAEEVYNKFSRSSTTGNYYSPALATLEFVKLRKQDAQAERDALLNKIDWSKAYSRERTVNTVRESIFSTSGSIKDTAEREQRARWIAERVADQLDADKKTGDLRLTTIQSYIVRASVEYDRQKKGESDESAATEPVAEEPAVAEAEAEEETEVKEEDDLADKAAQEVKDEASRRTEDEIKKKAKEGLRGIFGR